jgi:hypothetical protein
MHYQELFQNLKGVGSIDLSNLILPVNQTGYALYPINCRRESLDSEIIAMLTTSRNQNKNSFLTYFHATEERTSSWLKNTVAFDSGRILFVLKEISSNKLYGYMGLAYADLEAKRIEGDAIVRYSSEVIPGLMRLAFMTLTEWVHYSLNIPEIWVRVLSDNSAINFYKKCNFIVVNIRPLFEIRGKNQELEELTELNNKTAILSKKTISYMKFESTLT